MWRSRLPVNEKNALATAAPVIGTPSSPAPLGGDRAHAIDSSQVQASFIKTPIVSSSVS